MERHPLLKDIKHKPVSAELKEKYKRDADAYKQQQELLKLTHASLWKY